MNNKKFISRDFGFSVLIFCLSPIVSLWDIFHRIKARDTRYLYLLGMFFVLFGAFYPPVSDNYGYWERYYESADFEFNWAFYLLQTEYRDFLYRFLSYLGYSIHLPYEYFKFLLLSSCYILYVWMFNDIVEKHPVLYEHRRLYYFSVLSLFLSIRFFTIISGVRFGVASSWVVVAIYLLLDKKYAKGVLLYALSFFMHFSMLMILPIMLLAYIIYRLKVPYFFLLIIPIPMVIFPVQSFGTFLQEIFTDNEMIQESSYINGEWSTQYFLETSSFGGFMFTIIRILPVIPLTWILYKRKSNDYLSYLCFAFVFFLSINTSDYTVVLRYSNVTIALLFIAILESEVNYRQKIRDMQVTLVSVLIMTIAYIYSQRRILSHFYLDYEVIVSPIALVIDQYKYTDTWVMLHVDQYTRELK